MKASPLKVQTDARACGFTLVELLVVIAIIAILTTTLLPALSKAKLKTQSIACMNNHQQFAFAWWMYTEDSHDLLSYVTADHGPKASGPRD